ncbi:hypothetical protein ACFV23_32735 [Streptomyces sp. NPDC059627]
MRDALQKTEIPGITEPAHETEPHDAIHVRQVTPGIRILQYSDAKVVMKPWGRERWLHEAEAPYCFKVIRISAGCRTSLQYHRHKQESNFLLEGEAVMHYRETLDEPTQCIPMTAGTLVHVEAGSVHRIEAVTDIILVEVSTADDGSDTVRLGDDYQRRDGRVEAEH